MFTDSLVKIMEAGGSVSVEASGYMTDSLVRIAFAGKAKGAKLIIRNAKTLLTDSCIRIAAANPGHVEFIF